MSVPVSPLQNIKFPKPVYSVAGFKDTKFKCCNADCKFVKSNRC